MGSGNNKVSTTQEETNERGEAGTYQSYSEENIPSTSKDSQKKVQPSDCAEKSTSVTDKSVDANKTVADTIDYRRLAQEIVNSQRNISENVSDLLPSPDKPIENHSRNVQDDTSATHMGNKTTQENQILITKLLENTADRNIMERLQEGTIFQTVIDNIWKLLVSEISLDGEVKKMIEAEIITEDYVTQLEKYFDGKHDPIVKEILCYIYAQGTEQEQIFTKLLTILKKSFQDKINQELNKALGNNETNDPVETLEFMTSKTENKDESIIQLKAEIRMLRTDIETRVYKTLRDLKKEQADHANQLKSEDSELSKRMNGLEEQVNELKTNVKEKENKYEKLENENIALRARVETLTTELKKKEMESLEIEDKLKERNKVQSKLMQTKDKEIEELKRQHQEERENHTRIQNTLKNKYTDCKLLLDDKIKKLKLEKQTLSEELKLQEIELNYVKNEIIQLKEKIESLQKPKSSPHECRVAKRKQIKKTQSSKAKT